MKRVWGGGVVNRTKKKGKKKGLDKPRRGG